MIDLSIPPRTPRIYIYIYISKVGRLIYIFLDFGRMKRGNTRRRRGGVGKGCSACNSPDLMERGDLIRWEKGGERYRKIY